MCMLYILFCVSMRGGGYMMGIGCKNLWVYEIKLYYWWWSFSYKVFNNGIDNVKSEKGFWFNYVVFGLFY